MIPGRPDLDEIIADAQRRFPPRRRTWRDRVDAVDMALVELIVLGIAVLILFTLLLLGFAAAGRA